MDVAKAEAEIFAESPAEFDLNSAELPAEFDLKKVEEKQEAEESSYEFEEVLVQPPTLVLSQTKV